MLARPGLTPGIGLGRAFSAMDRPIAAAGALLSVRPGQWEAALRDMIESQRLRAELVRVSDALLVRDFSWERLEAGVLKILRLARARKMVA